MSESKETARAFASDHARAAGDCYVEIVKLCEGWLIAELEKSMLIEARKSSNKRYV